MNRINVTEFRQHLPGYLKQVRGGATLEITQNGKVVARLLPAQDPSETAAAKLRAWRKTAVLGDVLQPVDQEWEAEGDSV